MYFNAWSPNTVGSQTDAGIGANEYDPSQDINPSDVFAFVNSGGIWDPPSGQFVNTYEHWLCGQPVVILYGTLPSPYTGTSMLVVGTPAYNPSQFYLNLLPPATVILQTPAWTFFKTPASLDPTQNDGAQSGTYDGMPSNCMGCAVAQMFTIGEPNGADGSCYGWCNGGQGDGLWNEVVMGELVSPCGPNSFGLSNPCTIEWVSSWYNGQVFCPVGTCYYYSDSPNGTDQQVAEGLMDSNYSYPSSSVRSTAPDSKLQAPNLPTAPSYACTPDSDGYCAVVMNQVVNSTCTKVIETKNGPVAYTITKYNTTYDTFKKSVMLELQGTATEYQSVPSSGSCLMTTITWAPADPRVTYNDPNLP